MTPFPPIRPTCAATALVALSSCSSKPLTGPDPLGPEHIPVIARGWAANVHQEREFHLEHYREAEEAPPLASPAATRGSAGATGSISW